MATIRRVDNYKGFLLVHLFWCCLLGLYIEYPNMNRRSVLHYLLRSISNIRLQHDLLQDSAYS
ncbi:hypothetical protein K402DRAFT_147247 [Aulographum hederae CBS 113979]|uniref:Uncharacterized protein n=1 Tax=Aulographum hederae CBS 113979 TaxID=1176131 RepID=A0A6G1GTG4_9PEZI|nr:hypothetical protein K402DRAFT_147247 [Aulographum hederae CBS 113979]